MVYVYIFPLCGKFNGLGVTQLVKGNNRFHRKFPSLQIEVLRKHVKFIVWMRYTI